MDHPTRPAERRPLSPGAAAPRASALALALLLIAALGSLAGCKGSDEKKPDEEPAVALKIPESGELPAAADESDGEESPATRRAPARKPGAVQLKTSADPAADAAETGGEAGPATVTARTSKRLNGRPPIGPAAGKAAGKAAGLRPAPVGAAADAAAKPDPTAGAGAGADDPTAARRDGGEDTADAPADVDDEAEAGADEEGVPAPPELSPRTDPAPTRIAGRAPPRGAAPARKTDAPAGPPLDVERFLPLQAVRDVVGERRIMAVGPLAGISPAPGYNSVYYSVPGKETFGTAVQAWQDEDRRSSVERFRRMRRQYPNGEDVKLLAPLKAFYSSFGAIQTLTVTDTNKRLVVSVSCGEETCSQQVLLELAKHVQQQM